MGLIRPFKDKSIEIYHNNFEFDKYEEVMSDFKTQYEILTSVIAGKHTPGKASPTQCPVQFNSEYITEFKNFIFKNVINVLNIEPQLYYQFDWTFEPESSNYMENEVGGGYHHHINNNFGEFEKAYNHKLENQWSMTYYLQVPEADDAFIWFKDGDEEFNIEPKQFDLCIFPSSLLHRWDASPNSKKNRFVYVSNFLFLHRQNKKNITLL